MADKARIGGAYYELQADLTKFEASLRSAKGVASQAGTEIGASLSATADGAAASTSRAGTAFEGLTNRLFSWTAAMQAGVAIGTVLKNLLRDAALDAERFSASLNFQAPEQSLAAVNKRVAELQNLLYGSENSTLTNVLNSIGGDTIDKIRTELAAAEANQDVLRLAAQKRLNDQLEAQRQAALQRELQNRERVERTIADLNTANMLGRASEEEKLRIQAAEKDAAILRSVAGLNLTADQEERLRAARAGIFDNLAQDLAKHYQKATTDAMDQVIKDWQEMTKRLEDAAAKLGEQVDALRATYDRDANVFTAGTQGTRAIEVLTEIRGILQRQ